MSNFCNVSLYLELNAVKLDIFKLRALPSETLSVDGKIKIRFFMKLFRTSNIDTVKTCQLQFTFDLPSVIIEKRAKNLKIVLKLTTRILTTLEVFGAAGIALCTLLFTFVV